MEEREYDALYENERHHWWFGGMETITRRLLGRWYEAGEGLRILEAGCGTGGAMTTWLGEYGTVTGCDLSPKALGYCRRRKAERLAQATVTRLPFATGVFDLVTSFDVLYHQAVSDENLAVNEMVRVLVPGGRAVVRLPAYDLLRGRHDRAVHTRRRYTRKDVRHLLEGAGLKVEVLTYVNTLLFPLALMKRLLERLLPEGREGSDVRRTGRGLNALLRGILSLEAPLAASCGLPWGLSVVAVGRKTG